jgi:hypothetical protein
MSLLPTDGAFYGSGSVPWLLGQNATIFFQGLRRGFLQVNLSVKSGGIPQNTA